MVQSSCSGSVQWAFGTTRSPWQNAYVERLIGSIRRECLDHMIVFGEAHPRRILRGSIRRRNHRSSELEHGK